MFRGGHRSAPFVSSIRNANADRLIRDPDRKDYCHDYTDNDHCRAQVQSASFVLTALDVRDLKDFYSLKDQIDTEQVRNDLKHSYHYAALFFL